MRGNGIIASKLRKKEIRKLMNELKMSSSSSSSPEIILTSSLEGPIIAYDAISGTVLARFTGTRSPRHGLFLCGQTYIASSHISSTSTSGFIHLYNWWSPTPFHHISIAEPVAPLAATPDGSFLFAGGISGHVHSFSIPSGNHLKSYSAHNNKPVSCLILSDDCSLVISGGDDGSITVVPVIEATTSTADEEEEYSNQRMFHSFVAHDGPVTIITFVYYSAIISCSLDCTCKLWSLLDGTNLRTIAFPCPVLGFVLDPTETEFYSAGSDGSVYKGFLRVGSKREVGAGREVTPWAEKHGGAVVSMVLLNQGQNLASAAEDGSVYVWNLKKGKVIMSFGSNMESISDMMLVSGIGDGKRHRFGMCNNDGAIESASLSRKELTKSVNDSVDMEDVLSMVAKDKSKAIDMLESAITVYEKLLELILKEAKGGGNSKNSERGKD